MQELNQRSSTRSKLRVALALGIVVASAVIIYQQSKRDRQAPQQAGMPRDPNAIQLIVTKASGAPCQVVLSGGSQDLRHRVSLRLGDGKAESDQLELPGPSYTLDTVTVTRDGDAKPHEVNKTLHVAEEYEIKIDSDSVEIRGSACE